MSAPLVINGRFLAARPTGLHRTARALLDAAALHADVYAPPGTTDPRVTATLPAPPGRAGGHVFEQVALPLAARGRPILSLTNTAPLTGRRGYVMVHDLAPLVGPEWFARSMTLYLRLVLTAARRAEHVLTVSASVAEELAAAAVRAPISVIRPAVDPAFAPAPSADVTAARARLGLTTPYVLFVGWADPRKDLATAVAAHRRARTVTDHRLVLVGTPHPVFAPVALPDDPSVVHAGYVDDTALRALLTGAAALVYPSRYEGFGLPPLEAWACGTPALVSDVPALRESTGGRADAYLPVGDVDAWADAMLAALDGAVEVPAPPAWTWADAAVRLRTALGHGEVAAEPDVP